MSPMIMASQYLIIYLRTDDANQQIVKLNCTNCQW